MSADCAECSEAVQVREALRRLVDALPHDLAVMWVHGRREHELDAIDDAVERAERALRAIPAERGPS